MRKLILAGLAALSILPAQAQWLSPDAFGGAVWGGLLGGIIGHNSGRHTGEGIAIGAGAGLLLGALSGVGRSEPVYYPSYGASPSYYGYAPSYGYESRDYYRPNYAGTGAVFGGIAGAVIGNNSGHRGLEGAAIGAGAGLLLGSIAEQQARRQESSRTYGSTPVQSTPIYQPPAPYYSTIPNAPAVPNAPVVPPAPTHSTVANPYPTSPMSRANSLFGR